MRFAEFRNPWIATTSWRPSRNDKPNQNFSFPSGTASMPTYRILSDRIVPEPEGEGFLLPIPSAAPSGVRATMDAADFAAVEDAYRAAGFFRTQVNAFAPDWRAARPLLAIDLRGLVHFAKNLPGAPEGPGGQRKLWAAANRGSAAGIDVAGFLAGPARRDPKAELAAVLGDFLRQEKTSPFRLGRLAYWNFYDAGAVTGEPEWLRIGA
jgi:hypothetical protein